MGIVFVTIEWKIELLTLLCISFCSRAVDRPEVTSTVPNPYKVVEGHTTALVCLVIDANPNTNITWRWYRTDHPNNVLYFGPNYAIRNIQRNMSGSYSCTATNIIGTSEAVTVYLDVLYKPEVISSTPSQYKVIEGENGTLRCILVAANPNTNIMWRWFRTDSPSNVLYNGPIYTILNIHRNQTGSYNCDASNSVGTSVAVKIDVDVLYKPQIVDKTSTIVNEGDRVVLTKEIVSNPLSNVSWYNGLELLITQASVRNATLIKEKAVCTDTKNFTLVASNTVERDVSASVELIVFCKPRSQINNLTLGVSDTSGIEFSIAVIAYPEPRYELRYENGAINNKMTCSITRNAVNNFIIHFNQTVVEQGDYGVFHIKISNSLGQMIVLVNVLPQRKPTMPTNIEILCEVTSAKVQWISSFNGGDSQIFSVIVFNGQQRESQSDNISDQGENVIHSTLIQNLQPSTTYVLYVSASNKHGISSSESISCTTLKESTDNNLEIIAGGSAAGGTTLAVVIIVAILLLWRFKKRNFQEKSSDRDIPVRKNEDASNYTTLAERDISTERNCYEMLTRNDGANQYETSLIKESRENDGQMYDSLNKIENVCDEHMIDKNTKDLSRVYVNQSVTENSAEYINLSFSK